MGRFPRGHERRLDRKRFARRRGDQCHGAQGNGIRRGPLTSVKDQAFGFRTFGAMKFVNGYCGWQGNKNCSPFESWYVQFTNAIDGTSFRKESIKIDPPVDGLNIYPAGNYIYFQGYKKGRTSYKVTVDTSIKDILRTNARRARNGDDGRRHRRTEPLFARRNFRHTRPDREADIFDLFDKSAVGQGQGLRRYGQDWEAYRSYMRFQYYDEQKRPKIPGRLVINKSQAIEAKPDEMVETRIDLSEALSGGFGSAIIEVEPTVRRDKYDRTKITAWTQATQIGLDAFVDNEELVRFATDLKTGKPLNGVELSIYRTAKRRRDLP
ncbi:MAG: hypothetical protein IPJ30_14340 [Acidobacteria bacterium]|nr:hypothetical protein [Acidobacteriota bacterium]